jgi:hypothetical protein
MQPKTATHGVGGSRALLLFALACLGFVHFREAPPQRQSMRFQLPLPGKWPWSTFRLSPDGRYLVMSNLESGKTRGGSGLWIRDRLGPPRNGGRKVGVLVVGKHLESGRRATTA